jgi:hypothetical protein
MERKKKEVRRKTALLKEVRIFLVLDSWIVGFSYSFEIQNYLASSFFSLSSPNLALPTVTSSENQITQ